MRIHALLLVLAAFFVLVAGGCGGGSKAVPDDAVAVVGNDEITKAEFDAMMERAKTLFKQQRRPFPDAGTPEYKTLQNQAVQYLVQQAKYEQKADDLDVEITDEEIDKRLAQIKKQYFADNEQRYQQHLKTQGLTEEQVRNDVRQQLLSEEIFEKVTEDVKVSDEDIAEYYRKNKKDYEQAESREVRHILVGPNKRALADRIYNQLKGGASFDALAKRYSEDPSSKANGGKLTISRGQTVGAFDTTAFLLPKNRLSRPVKTTYGWHIIQPISNVRPPRTTPLKEVKEQIRQQLLQERRRKAITEWTNDVNEEFEDDIAYQVGYAPPATTGTTTTE